MKSVARLFAVVAMMAACLLLTMGSGAAVAASAKDRPQDNTTLAPGQAKKSDSASNSSNANATSAPGQAKKADSQPKPPANQPTAPAPATSPKHSQGNASTQGDYTKPQPLSNADHNSGGANGKCTSGPYCSTRDGAPSLNGNGKGKATGKPCAGCVGKADNKNPKGQYPNGSDHNAGYECDTNHGIGRTNPAHTGCKTTTPPVVPPTCTDNPATPGDDCNPVTPPKCTDNPATPGDDCNPVTPPKCTDNPATETDECGTETPPTCVDNPATETNECGTVIPPICIDNPFTTDNECGTEIPPVVTPPVVTPPVVTPPVVTPPVVTPPVVLPPVAPENPGQNPPVNTPVVSPPVVLPAGGPTGSSVLAPSSAKNAAAGSALPNTGSPADMGLALLAGLVLLSSGLLLVRRTKA